MHHNERGKVPREIWFALGFLALYEVLYFAFIDHWLSQWFVFKFRIPSFVSLGAFIVFAVINYYEYHGFGPQEGIVRRGLNLPQVALTFDDGPNPDFTPQILDVLKAKDVKASFFMVGRHVEKYPEVARRVFAEGHDVGNHTFSHRDMAAITKKTVLKEVNGTDEAIARVVGVRTRLFRPPRGIISNAVRRILVEQGFSIVMWTVSAVDWRNIAPKTMVKRILRHAGHGGIVLFHDSGALIRCEGASRGNTVEALPQVIDALRQRGYEIVPLSLMIKKLEDIETEDLIETLTPSSASSEA